MRSIVIICVLAIFALTLTGCEPYERVADMLNSTSSLGSSNAEERHHAQEQKSEQVGPASRVFVALWFSSLEEFLISYVAVRDGQATGSLAETSEKIGFASMDRLYLPINIPEAYTLYRVGVSSSSFSLDYLQDEHLVSESAIHRAEIDSKGFHFGFFRGFSAPPRDGPLVRFGITEDSLIDTAPHYTEYNHTFNWLSESGRVVLRLPRSPITGHPEITDPDDFLVFAPIRVIDLTDAAAVDALLVELGIGP